jgi:hypothetical protein
MLKKLAIHLARKNEGRTHIALDTFFKKAEQHFSDDLRNEIAIRPME